jgi:hypothetical protein
MFHKRRGAETLDDPSVRDEAKVDETEREWKMAGRRIWMRLGPLYYALHAYQARNEMLNEAPIWAIWLQLLR